MGKSPGGKTDILSYDLGKNLIHIQMIVVQIIYNFADVNEKGEVKLGSGEKWDKGRDKGNENGHLSSLPGETGTHGRRGEKETDPMKNEKFITENDILLENKNNRSTNGATRSLSIWKSCC